MQLGKLLKYKEIKVEEEKITLRFAVYFPITLSLSRQSPCRATVPNLFFTCIPLGSYFHKLYPAH